ncbi:MAG: hypothetical protein Q8Q37_02855 [bacterium]|nr:hypothetical protein [bacterium]
MDTSGALYTVGMILLMLVFLRRFFPTVFDESSKWKMFFDVVLIGVVFVASAVARYIGI